MGRGAGVQVTRSRWMPERCRRHRGQRPEQPRRYVGFYTDVARNDNGFLARKAVPSRRLARRREGVRAPRMKDTGRHHRNRSPTRRV